MSYQEFDSVWDAIEDTPEEARNMKIRSALMMQLKDLIEARGWTQVEAAHELGVNQPRISDLFQGKIARFSIDGLVNLVERAHAHVEMRVVADQEVA